MVIGVQSFCLCMLVLVSQTSHGSTHRILVDSSYVAASSAAFNFLHNMGSSCHDRLIELLKDDSECNS